MGWRTDAGLTVFLLYVVAVVSRFSCNFLVFVNATVAYLSADVRVFSPEDPVGPRPPVSAVFKQVSFTLCRMVLSG